MKQSRFKGVFELRKRKGKSIYTRNLTPGKKYYEIGRASCRERV